MKRALFIGGTGTISSAITERLAGMSGQWELYLLNRGNRPDRIPEGVHLVKADIGDEAEVERQLRALEAEGAPEPLFDCVCDFICFRPEQAERDWRLFRGRTRQFMFISTASAYQKTPPAPCEEQNQEQEQVMGQEQNREQEQVRGQRDGGERPWAQMITEETPLENPYWEYSRLKIGCEQVLMEKFRGEGFPVTIVRPSHTYGDEKIPLGVHGKKGSWQVARRMIEGKPVIIHGDGTTLWPITHNSDFAKGFVGLMGNPAAVGEAFHITTDECLSWNEIYQALADALGVELKAVHVASERLAELGPEYDFTGSLLGDKANSVRYDNSKLRSLVPDFEATMSFREGIKKTVDHLLAHPQFQYPDPDFDRFCDMVIARENAL